MPDLRDEIDWEKMTEAIRSAEQGIDFGQVPPLEPNKAPGGLVFQIVIEGVVAAETCSPAAIPSSAITTKAEADADLTVAALNAGKSAELRIFDGDTGIFIFRRQMIPR